MNWPGSTGEGTTGSIWALDHDDGSAYYEDFHNLLVYAGTKNYLGNMKRIGMYVVGLPYCTHYTCIHCTNMKRIGMYVVGLPYCTHYTLYTVLTRSA
jgi:hypothetical protein